MLFSLLLIRGRSEHMLKADEHRREPALGRYIGMIYDYLFNRSIVKVMEY